jgi:ribonuclease HI
MIKIWTDGSCLGNPGPGGWAFIASDGAQTVERGGGEKNTTNNRMELTAVLRALTSVKNPKVEIHTDSQYVKNGMQSWLKSWRKNGWKTADKKPVKNQDLWQALDERAAEKEISWVWVRGHNGEEMNERADVLARAEAEKQK